MASVRMSMGMSRFFIVTLRRLVSELLDLAENVSTAERKVAPSFVASIFLIALTTLGMIRS